MSRGYCCFQCGHCSDEADEIDDCKCKCHGG